MNSGTAVKKDFRAANGVDSRHSRVRIGAYPNARIDLSRSQGGKGMRNWALAAAAITAVLALATPAKNAAAVPIATPGQLGLAQGAAASVEKTVLVCGPWGCYWRPGY